MLQFQNTAIAIRGFEKTTLVAKNGANLKLLQKTGKTAYCESRVRARREKWSRV